MKDRRQIFTLRRYQMIGSLLIIFVLTLTPVKASAWDGSFFESVKDFVQNMYIENKTDEQIMENALKGMFSGLDDYSTFLNKEETKAYEDSLSGQFSGIGVTLESNEDKRGVVIGSVFKGSPAEKAGIQDGDVIIKADGKSLAGLTPAEAANIIKGKAGTKVIIVVLRGTKQMSFELIRAEIIIKPVSYRIDGIIGYLRIEQFTNDAPSGVRIALDAFKKKNIKKIILDLRDNPGGYVGSAVEIARLMLPPGNVVSLDFRSTQMSDVQYGTDAKNPNYLFAVLVNENTASASEILAGAIQDADAGILIGEKTFGKGVVQSMFMLLTPEAYEKYKGLHQESFVTDTEWLSYYGVSVQPDEVLGLAKLTTGKYLTRNGREIQGIGLFPDLKAENRTSAHEVDILFIDEMVFTKTLAAGSYDEAVRSAEGILKAYGAYTGTIDSHFDSMTTSAIKTYQKAKKITITGKLDNITAASLNKELKALRLLYDPQYKSAMKALGLVQIK